MFDSDKLRASAFCGFLLLAVGLPLVLSAASCPLLCNPSLCEPISSAATNCTRVTLDRCQCCAICERTLNESCTSSYADVADVYISSTDAHEQTGICELGLVCRNSTTDNGNGNGNAICTQPLADGDDGAGSCDEKIISKGCTLYLNIGCRCRTITSCVHANFQYEDEASCEYAWIKVKAMWRERCLKAKCEVVFQPKCPSDSILVAADAPQPPDCCRKPGSCQCDRQACKNQQIKCPPDHDLVTVEKGSQTPGSCCDVYKCIPPVLDCSRSHCPPEVVKECPEDSYHPTGQKITACCPVPEPCVCKPGACQPVVTCEVGFRLEIVKKGTGIPGGCCDVSECVSTNSESFDCDYDGSVFASGQLWHPKPCLECKCNNGLVFCKKHECPESNGCTLLQVPEGECCPVCIGCTSENGDTHNLTEQWTKDECTTCSCETSGKILCHKQMCAIDCDNPVKMPGQCCPVCEKPVIITLPFICPSVELCSLRCEHGMKRDPRGCFLCECNSDERRPWHNNTVDDFQQRDHCPYWDESTCPRKCTHGYLHDANECPVCKCAKCPTLHQCYKSCLHGFQSNVHGCSICKCRDGPVVSSSVSRSSYSSSTDLKDATASDDYPSCQSSTSTHDHGEWWFDGCRYCYCDRGREFCSILICPHVECANPQYDENECCPSCETSTGVSHNRLVCHAPGTGRNYVEGEFWHLNDCVECTCHIGHVLCHKRTCRPTPCAKPKLLPDQCCPVCQRTDDLLSNVPKNDSHCTIGPVAFSSGSMWKSNLCKSCTCNGGVVDCFDESCPRLNCKDKLLRLKNSCCPVCAEDFTNKICKYKESTYSVGEHWKDGPCRNCTCSENSEILCMQFECFKCPDNATMVPGQCCPVCEIPNQNWITRPPEQPPVLLGNYDQTQHLTVVLVLCSVGLAAIFIVLLLLFCWWRKRMVRRNSMSSSSRSEPILGGYRCHEGQTMLPKSNQNGSIKKNGTLVSPYDSDGASTGLTSEGV